MSKHFVPENLPTRLQHYIGGQFVDSIGGGALEGPGPGSHTTPTRLQHYIGGQFVDSIGGETFEVLDPVTNTTYATAAAGQKADIDAAVDAATEAFKKGPWPTKSARARAKVLYKIADAVVAQED